jgi:hypothetical protein
MIIHQNKCHSLIVTSMTGLLRVRTALRSTLEDRYQHGGAVLCQEQSLLEELGSRLYWHYKKVKSPIYFGLCPALARDMNVCV